MRYEAWIAIRYLLSKRSAREPSLIAIISMLAVAVSVAVLILVLSVMGGFEGDLRTKILGTRAHLLVNGPDRGDIVDYADMLGVIDEAPGVEGACPFVESELMISSPTNYTGVVIRGVDTERVTRATSLADYMKEGELAWLHEPELAIPDSRRPGSFNSTGSRIDDLRRRLDELEREIDGAAPEPASGDSEAAVDGAEREDPDRDNTDSDANVAADGAAPLMPALPPPRRTPPGAAQSAADRNEAEMGAASPRNSDTGDAETGPLMPGLPAPHTPGLAPDNPSGIVAAANESDAGAAPTIPSLPPFAGRRSAPARELPGLIVGSELKDTLHVEVGDTVSLISPDGDLGPSGPIPRSRPFRVVGVFFTGLYEYDNTMAYSTLESARELLNIESNAVSGIEIKVQEPDNADEGARDLDRRLAAAGHEDVEVRDWKELNRSLFAALLLEKVGVGVTLGVIIVVSGFAIICVLIMVSIEKRREIAVLKSLGASRRAIRAIFVIFGLLIGVVGAVLGVVLGLGATTWLQTVGIPIDPNVYYIDRLPVEVDPTEVIVIAVCAVVVSLLATVIPSGQAAALDPVIGLREE